MLFMQLGTLGHTESDLGQLEQLPTTLLQNEENNKLQPSLEFAFAHSCPAFTCASTGLPTVWPRQVTASQAAGITALCHQARSPNLLGLIHSLIHSFIHLLLFDMGCCCFKFLYGSHSLDKASLELTFQSRLACDF